MDFEKKSESSGTNNELTHGSEQIPYLSNLPDILRRLQDESGTSSTAEALLNELSPFAYDENLSLPHAFVSTNGEKIESAGVSVLGRAGVASAFRKNPNLIPTIIDIASLRAADQAQGQGNSADVLLANLAAAYKNAFPDAVVARLGGDEFVICVPNLESTLIQQIGDITHSVEAFFGGEKKAVEAKYVITSTPPEDPGKKAIYDYFLRSRGLPLSPEDLEKISTLPKDEELLPGFTNNAHKLLELERIHPELAQLFSAAKAHFQTIPDPALRIQFVNDLYEYIITIIYHPLLKDKVGSVQSFESILGAKQISETWTFTIKIKEINDQLGLAAGDQAIIELFNTIKKTIDPTDRPNITFYSQGGTIHVGVRSGVQISDETRDRLNAIVKVDLEGEPFFIGNSHIDITLSLEEAKVTLEPQDISPAVVRNVLESNADFDWHEKVIGFMGAYLAENPHFLDDESITAYEPFTFAEQIRLYLLNEKRRTERTGTLFDILTQIMADYHEDGGNIRSAFRHPGTAPLGRRVDDILDQAAD